MIKYSIFVILLSFSGFFFIGPGHSYSVLLPLGTQLVQIDTLEGGILNHTFIGKDSKEEVEFSMSFSVVSGESKNLTDEKTIKKYQEDCNCEIVDVQKVIFPNFSGARYSILKDVDDIKLAGKVYISELKNGKSINVVGMILYDDRKKLSTNMNEVLNTLVLNF